MTDAIVRFPRIWWSRVRWDELGISFPQVFRKKNGTKSPEYDIHPDDIEDGGWDPINLLTPGIDDCWVIVRYHLSEMCLLSYLEGLVDSGGPETRALSTEYGLYTLITCPPRPQIPNNLIIFCATVLKGGTDANVLASTNFVHVIDSDGQIHDGNFLDRGIEQPDQAHLENLNRE